MDAEFIMKSVRKSNKRYHKYGEVKLIIYNKLYNFNNLPNSIFSSVVIPCNLNVDDIIASP